MVEFTRYKTYEEYLTAQIDAGTKKKTGFWIKPHTIDMLVKKENRPIESVICHGVRTGRESEKFAEYATNVVGTEISRESIEYNKPNYKKSTVVEWDFNKQNLEWIGKFDIVYSNCLDHAYDPLETLEVWIDQLKDNGTLCLDCVNFADAPGASDWDPYQDTPDHIEEYVTNVFSMKLKYSFWSLGGKNNETKILAFTK